MEESTSREKIMKNIRNALIEKPDWISEKIDWDTPIYTEMKDSPDVVFAQEFTKVGGKFLYCENEHAFVESLKILLKDNQWEAIYCPDKKLEKLLTGNSIPIDNDPGKFMEMKAGLTTCEFLVSRVGSVMVSSNQAGGRRLNVFPETHLVMAFTSQLVPDLKDALKAIRKKYNGMLPSMISNITGPSRTADIEKTLVMGAHGPKELFVFLIEDQS